jgi:hypothetical protein
VPDPFIVQMKALVGAMEPIQFYSCFISYSTKDQEFADRLYADLQPGPLGARRQGCGSRLAPEESRDPGENLTQAGWYLLCGRPAYWCTCDFLASRNASLPAASGSVWTFTTCSAHRQQLDLKHQLRVRRNHTQHPVVSVRQVWTNTEPTTAANAHPLHAPGEPSDGIALANRERDDLVRLEGLAAIEVARVTDSNAGPAHGDGTIAELQLVNTEAAQHSYSVRGCGSQIVVLTFAHFFRSWLVAGLLSNVQICAGFATSIIPQLFDFKSHN